MFVGCEIGNFLFVFWGILGDEAGLYVGLVLVIERRRYLALHPNHH
jgi:hypothetical protein